MDAYTRFLIAFFLAIPFILWGVSAHSCEGEPVYPETVTIKIDIIP